MNYHFIQKTNFKLHRKQLWFEIRNIPFILQFGAIIFALGIYYSSMNQLATEKNQINCIKIAWSRK